MPAVSVYTWQPTEGVPEVDDGGAHLEPELEGETRDTQFRQVRAAMCVIPYVLYVTCSLIYCMIIGEGPCPTLYCTSSRVTSRLGTGVLVEYD